jgi:hypothetical protein
VQHHAEAFRALWFWREVEPCPDALDAFLGAADALGHRRLGDQEGVRDLRRGQPADRAKREGQLRRDGQGGMTAQEQNGERVVLLRRLARAADLEEGFGLLASAPSALAPPAVDQAPRRGGHEPRPGMVGHALLRPLRRRREQRLLHGILRGVELPVPAHQRAEDLRRELAQQILDAGSFDRHGRNARRPRPRAADPRCRSCASGASPAWPAATVPDPGRRAARTARSG